MPISRSGQEPAGTLQAEAWRQLLCLHPRAALSLLADTLLFQVLLYSGIKASITLEALVL